MKPNDIIAGKLLITSTYLRRTNGHRRRYVMAKCLCGNINEYMVYYLKINKDKILKCEMCYNKKFGTINKTKKKTQ